MRALIYIVIDIDCEIQSKVRQKTEYILKVHGIEGYKLFGPYIRYEIPIYQDDPFYMNLLRLEKMIRKYNEVEESGVEWMCFGVSAEYTEKEKEKVIGYCLETVGGNICKSIDCKNEYFVWCEVCGYYSKQLAPYVFQKSQQRKKWFSEKTLFAADVGNEVFVTESMYKYCVENGISKDCFQPAYFGKKRIELAGYQIKAEQILLPGAFVSEQFQIQEPCEKCGESRMKYVDNPYYMGLYLDNNKVSKLRDVNAVYEYCGSSRKLIFGKKISELFMKTDSKIRMVPVFPLSVILEMESMIKTKNYASIRK